MNPTDQWYYLEGSETRGPVPSAQIAQLIKAGSLSPATQVAQAGWPKWSAASDSLSHLLSGGQQASGHAAAPVEVPTYAIKVQCVSGPDVGKAYMIAAAEVSLGRVSGIGQHDPQVAENHVVLSWQSHVLYFRTFAGSKLKIAGAEVTQGTISNGQQFHLGASTWQVGTAPVELTNLLGSLGARLNKLTSTEKLEGFSLSAMFSEVFKARKPGEIEDYFVVGTSKTTPPIEDVQTGWPKPWFFMRVLIFMGAIYFLFSWMVDLFHNPRIVPGLMMMGSLVVPLSVVFLIWELNTPRNVSFVQVLMLVCMGGVISLVVTHIVGDISSLDWLGAASAGIEEETAKLLAVVIVVRNLRYKYILNGIVFGAAIGCGFAAFETAGYVFADGYLHGFLRALLGHMDILAKVNPKDAGQLNEVIQGASMQGYPAMYSLLALRSYLAPFGHVVWTAITAGALWRVKSGDPFRLKMLANPFFLRTFAIPVLLHMIWNSPLFRFEGILFWVKYLGLGFIAWYLAFTLVQQGLRQIRDAQLAQTKVDMTRTQEILTTSGRFRLHRSTI
jgi:RsiW-degrading membrane proteinase PrsW (M82 family)